MTKKDNNGDFMKSTKCWVSFQIPSHVQKMENLIKSKRTQTRPKFTQKITKILVA